MDTVAKPQCIGFIMDGNRRWARGHDLPTLSGHQKGAEVFSESIKWVQEAGIPHAVYYAFSTENWKRSEAEVGYLLNLFHEWFREHGAQNNVRTRIVGRRADFAPDLQAQMQQLEEASVAAASTTIWVALSYGGRAEIVAAVNEAVKQGELVDETAFEQLLWSAEMPDPDIIVRTGGEQRLSNFMTWKSVYSEFLFLEKQWPALTKSDFDGILSHYGNRERRKGI